MLEILKENLNYLFLAVAVSILFAPIMIELLYRFNQVSGVKKSKIGGIEESNNSVFMRIMRVTKTNGTPNMGRCFNLDCSSNSHVFFNPYDNNNRDISLRIFTLWALGIHRCCCLYQRC